MVDQFAQSVENGVVEIGSNRGFGLWWRGIATAAIAPVRLHQYWALRSRPEQAYFFPNATT